MKYLNRFLPVVLGVVIGFAGSTPASAALCTLQQLNTVLGDYLEFGSTSQTCDWRGRFEPSFQPWSIGGSENRPVVAAAIKLYADGDSAATNWWLTYLRNQLGDLDDGSLPLKVRRFHSSELFSSGYDAHTSRSVAAAHLWAWQNGSSTIQDLARRWLRATWYTYALAAAPAPAEKLFSIGNTTVEKNLPDVSKADAYVQVPSPRSDDEGWQPVIPAFARARGFTPKQWTPNELKRIELLLGAQWSGTEPNVYGLTGTDRSNINGIINNGSVSSSVLQSVYGNAKFVVNLHFFGFGNGARVAVIEPNGANYNHTQIIFASKVEKDANGDWIATLLTPWWGDTTNLGSSSFNLSTRTVTATGDFTRTLSMPGTTIPIVYNVKLGTSGVVVQ